MKLLHEVTGRGVGADEKGVLDDRAAAAAGLHDDRLGRRRALRQDLLLDLPQPDWSYSTFDWATRDADGYYFVLGRTDDVINVAGHRLGTREIEEAVQAHSGIAEVAVVGVADPLKGQMPVAFAVVKDPARVATPEGVADDAQGGDGHRRPRAGRDRAARARCTSSPLLPKTRSGKLLRRSIQALAEGRDPGDLTTIEDPAALEQIRNALAALGPRQAVAGRRRGRRAARVARRRRGAGSVRGRARRRAHAAVRVRGSRASATRHRGDNVVPL